MFSQMDLATGFHQLRISKESVLVIAFRASFGFYEWLVMPFGLTNMSAYFMESMNKFFRDQSNKFVLVFVDDILVYSKMEEEHKTHLRVMLKILRKHQLKAKFLKCHSWRRDVRFLGHLVSEQGIVVDPAMIEAIEGWTRP